MPYYWLVPVLVAAAAVVLARVTLILATVQGDSMSPTLEPGDRVLVVRSWAARKPRRDDVVLTNVTLPALPVRSGAGQRDLYVKRVASVEGDRVEFRGQMFVLARGEVFIVGDNGSHSFDSRQFGAISTHDIVGRVLSRVFASSGTDRAATGNATDERP